MKAWNQMKITSGHKETDRETIFSTQWAKDLKLLEWGTDSLFSEYLEMGTFDVLFLLDLYTHLTVVD
jgi:hypothetical protein